MSRLDNEIKYVLSRIKSKHSNITVQLGSTKYYKISLSTSSEFQLIKTLLVEISNQTSETLLYQVTKISSSPTNNILSGANLH